MTPHTSKKVASVTNHQGKTGKQMSMTAFLTGSRESPSPPPSSHCILRRPSPFPSSAQRPPPPSSSMLRPPPPSSSCLQRPASTQKMRKFAPSPPRRPQVQCDTQKKRMTSKSVHNPRRRNRFVCDEASDEDGEDEDEESEEDEEEEEESEEEEEEEEEDASLHASLFFRKEIERERADARRCAKRFL